MPKSKLKPRKDGRYQKSIIDKNGKRIYFYGTSEREINKKILEYEEKQQIGKIFSEVADEWWNFEVEKLSPSTVKGYNCATKRIVEHFGDQSISDIKTADINRFLMSLARLGYAKKTVKNHKIIINRIFHFAIVSGYIHSNPANDSEIPRNLPQKKRRPASETEESIIKKSTEIWLLPYMALTTGLRKGELLGLRWEDIDLKSNIIHVRRSVWYGPGVNIKSPKTEAGVRKVPIISPLHEELIKRIGKPQHYVFGGEQPMTDKAYRYQYQKFQKQTGIVATAQQLRKSYATLAVGANIPPDVLKTIFGHRDISTTLNLYAEVRDYRITEAGSLFESHFSESKTTLADN